MNDRFKLALLSVLAAAAQSTAGAELIAPQAATPEPAARVVPAQLNGTIVAVNREARTVIVDVQGKGKLLTVNVTRQLRITKNGKRISFEELAPGQTVNLALIELADGQIEVAALSIGSNPESLQGAGDRRRVPTLPPQAPFTTPPNPANVGAPPISPQK